MLTREQILATRDLERQTVHVPKWSGDVIVRALTAKEREELELAWSDVRAGASRRTDIRATLLSKVLINEEGKRLFTDEDIVELNELDAEPIQELFRIAQEMSGLAPERIEELVGNSEGDHSEPSLSE